MSGESPASAGRRRIRFLGYTLDVATMDDLNARIASAIADGEKIVVANQNLHALYLAERDASMKRFFETADVVHVDGMSLVALARLFGLPLERRHRVTYVDWIHPLMRLAAERGWRVFYLGGEPGVADKAAATLLQEHPDLVLATRHGYFDVTTGSSENEEVLDQIAGFGTDLLLVGMGMPRQEKWVLETLPRLSAHAILMAGACFDYIAGVVPTPPRWTGRMGLEWLFRLVAEPRRLFRRYLVEPWYLLPAIAREIASPATRKDEADRGD